VASTGGCPQPQQCQFSLCTGLQSGNLEDNAGAAYRRTIELDRNYLNAYLGLGVVLLRQETTTRLFGHTSKCSPANLITNAYELMGAMLMQQGRSKSDRSTQSQQRWSKTPVCFCSWDLFG